MPGIATERLESLRVDETLGDTTGCLEVVARYLRTLEPSLLLLADDCGTVLAADDLGSGIRLEVVAALGREIAQRTASGTACWFKVPTPAGRRFAFGIPFQIHGDSGILGGRVRWDRGSSRQLDSLETTLAVCGRLAWIATQASLDAAESGAREQGQTAGPITAGRTSLPSRPAHVQKLETIGQLAVGIAHEINTPTQFLGDNVRFLRDAYKEIGPVLAACAGLRGAVDRGGATGIAWDAVVRAVERAKEYEYLLDEIPKAIRESLGGLEDVARIVGSIREFSYPGDDRKQAIDLAHVIQSALTVSQSEWKYVAEAVTELAPDLPPLESIPGDLGQVLLNLIVNAAHAIEAKSQAGADEKGTITIRARPAGEWIEVEVEDTGTGIPEAIRGKVFEPFFTTKEVGQGTGQGLAIARAIVVDRYGGELTFETEEGRGTTFRIRIPAQSGADGRGRISDEKADYVRR
jgi:signal transduction histidine kinase